MQELTRSPVASEGSVLDGPGRCLHRVCHLAQTTRETVINRRRLSVAVTARLIERNRLAAIVADEENSPHNR